MKKVQLLILLLLLATTLPAQSILNRVDSIKVIANGNTLDFALVGGLNTPQFSSVDLNNDGNEDLYIYDRNGKKSLTFLSDGTKYTYAPEFEDNFPPDIRNFVLLRDYNCDGIKDVFTYPSFPIDGIEAYKGYYDANNEIAFTKITFPGNQFDFLFYPGFNNFPTNIYVPRDDYPAIDDIDGDGDLDILAFNPAGGYVSLFENQSIDLGYGCDTLIFELVDNCWGRFFESGINEGIGLSPQVDSCFGTSFFIGGRHSGSTLLTLDMDNDGDKELILGDLSFTNLTLLTNGGTPDTAFMTAQDTFFPSNDVSADIVIFPAAFHLDVDFDGMKDLVGAPNLTNTAGTVSENYEVSWFWKNQGTNENPVFSYQQDDFLVDEMLDFGSIAAPTYFDYNGDSLQDLVVGSFGFFGFGGNYTSKLALYKNTGTKTSPEFTLIDDDYLNVSALGLRQLHPTFGDVDGDGDTDLILGEETGKLYYYENTAGAGVTASFAAVVPQYQGIDVGQASTPQLFDVDKDGLIDLLIGDRNGLMSFYKNTGTLGSPTFTFQPNNNYNNNFGNVDTRAIGYSTGYSNPFMIDRGGVLEFFVGSESGKIFQYTDIENNMQDAFTLVTAHYDTLFEGLHAKIDIRDLNDDGQMEFTIGNVRGGVSIYSEGNVVINTEPIRQDILKVNIFPNPTKDYFDIKLDESGNLEILIYNSLGKLLYSETTTTTINKRINTTTWASGIYYLQLTQNGKSTTQKIAVLK